MNKFVCLSFLKLFHHNPDFMEQSPSSKADSSSDTHALWLIGTPQGSPLFSPSPATIFYRREGEHSSSPLPQHISDYKQYLFRGGPGSSVGIATELWAGRSGIESRWGRDFPPVQTGRGANPVSLKMGTGSFPGVKRGRGVLLTTHPLLVPLSRKSRAIPLPTLWATPGL